MTPRDYTLTRIVLLGLDIKSREGRDDYRVRALRELYLSLKDGSDAGPHISKVRGLFIGLDLIHLDRILIDEKRIHQLEQRKVLG
jgi:hypothetical protein